jgi:hypothetical protein
MKHLHAFLIFPLRAYLRIYDLIVLRMLNDASVDRRAARHVDTHILHSNVMKNMPRCREFEFLILGPNNEQKERFVRNWCTQSAVWDRWVEIHMLIVRGYRIGNRNCSRLATVSERQMHQRQWIQGRSVLVFLHYRKVVGSIPDEVNF